MKKVQFDLCVYIKPGNSIQFDDVSKILSNRTNKLNIVICYNFVIIKR